MVAKDFQGKYIILMALQALQLLVLVLSVHSSQRICLNNNPVISLGWH